MFLLLKKKIDTALLDLSFLLVYYNLGYCKNSRCRWLLNEDEPCSSYTHRVIHFYGRVVLIQYTVKRLNKLWWFKKNINHIFVFLILQIAASAASFQCIDPATYLLGPSHGPIHQLQMYTFLDIGTMYNSTRLNRPSNNRNTALTDL